ncbi:hypothetical protein IG518_22455, partial [Vibrio cholerae]|nr:hypothetical protein [Vibrio cholerae]
MIHPVLAKVTENLIERSREARAAFIARSQAQEKAGKGRTSLSCGNLAHAVAA